MRPVLRLFALLALAAACAGAGATDAQSGANARASSSAAPAKHDGAAAKQPTLDVAALKERLRETKAIGFFTKL